MTEGSENGDLDDQGPTVDPTYLTAKLFTINAHLAMAMYFVI